MRAPHTSGSRRFLRRGTICALLLALGVTSGVVEARSAPNWLSRLGRAVSSTGSASRARAMLSDTTTIFGPKTFALGTATSATFVEAFAISPTQAPSGYILHVTNAPTGLSAVTGGTISLNGSVVFSSADIAALAAGSSRDVALYTTLADTIAASLQGPAGSGLRVSVLAVLDPTFTVFGPKSYERGTSDYDVTETFTMPAGAAAPTVLCVSNGTTTGTRRNAGSSVTLNGSEVIHPSDMTGATSTIRRFVTLHSTNTMVVHVAGTPNSVFTLCATATDSLKPALTITAPVVNRITRESPINILGTVADQTITRVTVNGLPMTLTLTSPGHWSYTGPVPLATEGANVLTFTAIDAAGNRTDSTRTVIRDTQAPVVTVTSLPDTLTSQSSVLAVVSGKITDNTKVTATINGAAVTIDSVTHAYSRTMQLAYGVNFITVTATDAGGNATSVVRQVKLDNVAPVITITAPTEGLVTQAAVQHVVGNISDISKVTLKVSGAIVPLAANGAFVADVPLVAGSNTITFDATDALGNHRDAVRHVVRDNTPPTVTIASPSNDVLVKTITVTVSGTITDAAAVTAKLNGVPLTIATNNTFQSTIALSEGPNTITLVATDAAGNVTTTTRSVTLDTTAPTLVVNAPLDNSSTTAAQATVSGTATDQSAVHVAVNGSAVTVGGSGAFSTTVALNNGSNTITVVATDSVANVTTVTRTVTRTTPPPPPPPTGFVEKLGIDNSVGAPQLDRTVLRPISATADFLYTGPSAPQQGVAVGTISKAQAGILRGRVLDRSGAALGGVTVRALNHPEYGAVQSRANGLYEFVVNAGGSVTLDYQKTGLIPAQRSVVTEQQDFTLVPDVALVTLDSASTVVTFTAPLEVARASSVTDLNGTRTATMLFTQGTVATATQPNGASRVLPQLTVRATEYTVGPAGRTAMPGKLPATSEYTYALELSADEVPLAGSEALTFSKPVAFYVENFRAFPLGMPVPMAYYDRQRGVWVPEDNGRVVMVQSVSGGSAVLSVSADSTPASQEALDSLGVTPAELARVGQLYTAGQSLWRAPISHFSPHDGNVGNGDTRDKRRIPDDLPPADADDKKPDPCKKSGSIIECENQILGETLPIAGTGLTLNYRSDRIPGRGRYYTIVIPVTGDSLPALLADIELDVHIAGRMFEQHLSATPNQKITFRWDGLDAFGRPLVGPVKYDYVVQYRYPKLYGYPPNDPQAFGLRCVPSTSVSYILNPGGQPLPGQDCVIPGVSDLENNLTIRLREFSGVMGSWIGAGDQGQGGWTLEPHHVYEPVSKTLYLGSGDRVSGREVVKPDRRVISGGGTTLDASSSALDSVLATSVRHGTAAGIVVTPRGDVLFADSAYNRVRAVSATGTITRFAGLDGGTMVGDAARATTLTRPRGLALGPDGSVYIADAGNHRVIRVRPDSIVEMAAGNGGTGSTGDGGLATAAEIGTPSRVAAGLDGSLFILDGSTNTVRVVTPSGRIATVAGAGNTGQCRDDGIVATESCLIAPNDIAVAPDGTLYIADVFRVRVVRPNGFIGTIAGRNRGCSSSVYEGPGLQLALCANGLAVTHDGTLYITDARYLRRVDADGYVVTVHTCGPGAFDASALPTAPLQLASATFHGPNTGDGEDDATRALVAAGNPIVCLGVAVGPDGSVYASEAPERVVRIGVPNPGYSATDFIIAAPDGSEFYEFDVNMRHVATRNTTDARLLQRFTYDASQRVSAITDRFNQQVVITRDASGNATAITAPFGQATTLSYDTGGWLAGVRYPDNGAVAMTYATGGLLASIARPALGPMTFVYDSLGRFASEEGALGWQQSVAVQTDPNGQVTASFTDASGVTTTHGAEGARGGTQTRIATKAGGGQVTSASTSDGTSDSQGPDGSSARVEVVGDTIFGMQVPRLLRSTVQSGSGQFTATATHSVVLANSADVRSITAVMDTITLNGMVSTSTVDVLTGILIKSRPDGLSDTTFVDQLGQVMRERTSGLAASSYLYDPVGRLTRATLGDRFASREYGADGFVSARVNPLGLRTSYVRDAMGRIIAATRADSQTVYAGYDAAGRLTSFAPAGRPAYLFAYDAAGRIDSIMSPAVGSEGMAVTRYAHDAGRLTATTRPDGSRIALQYGSLGELVHLSAPGIDHDFAYDAATGLLQTVASSRGDTLSLGYDGSLVSWQSWTGRTNGTARFGYAPDLSLARVSVDNGMQFDYQYGPDGKLASVDQLAFGYDAATGVMNQSTIDAVGTRVVRDTLGQIRTASHTFQGATLLRHDMSFDRLGRIDSLTETIGTATTVLSYRYDGIGRLVSVIGDGNPVATYQYDTNGNRVGEISALGSTVATYDARDRLVQYGGAAYTYTTNGERATRTVGTNVTTYTHDAMGHLVRVGLPDGRVIGYQYDPQGRRIGRQLNGAVMQRFIYQSQVAPAAQYDSLGQIVAQFVYATRTNVPDVMVMPDGTRYRLVLDERASVRMVVNVSTGEIAQRIDYDPWGRVTLNTNPGFQPFGYAGGLQDDDTRMVHFGAREYDPETGQWAAADPIGFAGGSANHYGYAHQDPITYADPEGLWPTDIHNQMLDIAFKWRHCGVGDLDAFKRISLQQDSPWPWGGGQNIGKDYTHAMAEPGEDPQDAVERRDDFISHSVTKARALAAMGDDPSALQELGAAFHAMMDETSPWHVLNGVPWEWYGIRNPDAWGLAMLHSILEGGTPVTHDIYQSVATRMRGAFDAVFAGTCHCKK